LTEADGRWPVGAPTALRFIVVGLAATVTYAVCAIALNRSLGELGAVKIHLIAFAVSLLVSYLGHHQFTFSLRGRHEFYLPRFVFVTACLLLASTAMTYVCDRVLRFDATAIAVGVSIFYPIASYLANLLWTFRADPGAGRDASGGDSRRGGARS
jgi:putative flippase GtrA